MSVYSGETVHFYTAEQDQFRNPVGSSIRENLAVLLKELLGNMDACRIKEAVSAIVRIRAVQNLTRAEAAGFFLPLRSIISGFLTGRELPVIDQRIDVLNLIAYDEYEHCREQLSSIRLNERRRAVAVPAAMARARQ